MIGYVARRLVICAVTLFIVVSATWLLTQALPGTPFNDERLPEEVRATLFAQYGLDDPLPVQYARYMGNVAQGDLGNSFYFNNRPVTDVLMSRLPISAFLGIQALVIGVPVGIALGAVAALRRNTPVDSLVMFVAVMGIAVPSIVLAPLAQYVLGLRLGLFPIAFWESWWHSVLPSLVLASSVMAVVARYTRTEMLDVLGQEYVNLAKSKGVGKLVVIYRHVLRNSMIPLITIIVPLTAALITGTLIVEQVFALPGIGEQFVTAIFVNDYTMIMGTTILFATLFVLSYLVQDVLYSVVDPRIRLTGGGE